MPSLSDYGAPYPEAAPGQDRKVIYLPALHDSLEQEHMRVQLIPGRHEDCEDGRLYHLTGTISEGTVEGWGYNYYVVTLGDIYAAHRNPADTENASTFVAMYENPIIRYNSKLPIVVYVPEGAEVRYRVWMDEAGRVAHANGTPAPAAPPAAAENYADMEELDADPTHGVKVQEYPDEEPHASRGIPQLSDYAETPANPTQSTEAFEEPHAEAARHRGIPALTNGEEEDREAHAQAQRGYVEEAKEAPALRASETAATPREAEASPEGHHHHKGDKSDPNSERRRRSSSKPRKHSALENGAPKQERPRGLSATEASPGEGNAKSATERSSSSKHDRRGSSTEKRASTDKSNNNNNESANSDRRGSTTSNKDKDGAYEKKAKNFWNRARGSSKSKSPQKSDGKGGQWSEM